MTNCEFYKNKIRNIGIYNLAVDKETGVPCACNVTFCKNCLINAMCTPEKPCSHVVSDWLLAEHEGPESESEPEVDWSKVPVDTPIHVSDDNLYWANRHFAKYENGVVYAWFNGATSFSTPTTKSDEWRYAKLAKNEDSNT